MSEIDYCKFKGHTNGPWFWRGQHNGAFLFGVTRGGGWADVIQPARKGMQDATLRFMYDGQILAPHEKNKPEYTGSYPVDAPDAVLIAAAPALLERCLVLESVVENMKGGLIPQTVALAKALERGRVADREIDALSDEALHLRVQVETQRREIEALKDQIERSQ